MRLRYWSGLAAVLLLAGCQDKTPAGPPHVTAESDIEAGRYLILIGQCNDCHTAGYAQNGGTTPEKDRLTGNPVGYQGPWGTSYAVNLRLLAESTTEQGWVDTLKTKRSLPPMPSPNISKMHEADLRAMYRYVRSLGAAGDAMPKPLPPGVVPVGPYEVMTPVLP